MVNAGDHAERATAVRISRLHHPVTALGPGRRLAIWFQGCGIGCQGCASADTWDVTGGTGTDVGALLDTIDAIARREQLDGITFTGGEPFDQPEALAALLDGLTSHRSAPRLLDVLCFSGRPLRHLERHHPRTLARLDAIVAGPYVRTRPTRRIWCGSDNQRITPLSALGHERYAPFIDLEVDRPELQVAVDESVWLIGVPRPGDLDRLETDLAARGVRLDTVSWRA